MNIAYISALLLKTSVLVHLYMYTMLLILLPLDMFILVLIVLFGLQVMVANILRIQVQVYSFGHHGVGLSYDKPMEQLYLIKQVCHDIFKFSLLIMPVSLLVMGVRVGAVR